MPQTLVNKSLNHLPTIDVGRRFCTSRHHKGRRWLPISYFHAAAWEDPEKTIPKRLQARCKTCQVIESRIQSGIRRRGKPYRKRQNRTGWKRATPEEQEQYRKYSRRKYANETEEQRDNRRERERIRAEGKRREEGIAPRKMKRLEVTANQLRVQQPGEPVMPARPLAEFLEEFIHRHGMANVETHGRVGRTQLDAILEGDEGHVTLELADRILTGLGYPELLATLYPVED